MVEHTSRRRSQPGGWVSPSGLPQGPNGRALCRQCSTEVPKGRLTFCSNACVVEWRIRTNPQVARNQVYRRDRGVCALCGLDTEYLTSIVRELEQRADGGRKWDRYYSRDCTGQSHRLNPIGDERAQYALQRLYWQFFGKRMSRWGWSMSAHLWEADHIVPVIEGGGECGLDNLRTLCLPCHRTVTRQLHERLRAARAAGRAPTSLALLSEAVQLHLEVARA